VEVLFYNKLSVDKLKIAKIHKRGKLCSRRDVWIAWMHIEQH